MCFSNLQGFVPVQRDVHVSGRSPISPILKKAEMPINNPRLHLLSKAQVMHTPRQQLVMRQYGVVRTYASGLLISFKTFCISSVGHSTIETHNCERCVPVTFQRMPRIHSVPRQAWYTYMPSSLPRLVRLSVYVVQRSREQHASDPDMQKRQAGRQAYVRVHLSLKP